MEKYGNSDTTGEDKGDEEKAVYEGMEIISSMSQVNINELIDRVSKEIPSTDRKRARDREKMINWDNVAFKAYGANKCRLAWNYLMSNTRKYRIMDELVAEIKLAMETKQSRQKFLNDGKQCVVKPPKFRSAYDVYVRDKWNEHVAECSQSNKAVMNFMKFRTMAGKQYAQLSEEEKEVYKKESEMISTEYDKKLQEFYDRFPKTAETNKKSANQIRNRVHPDAPKSPHTAQTYFLEAKLQKLEVPPQELSALKTKYLQKYQKLSDKKKGKWIDCAIAHCEKYETDLKEYISSHPKYNPPAFKVKNILKKSELEIWEKLRDKPRAPKTKYGLFEDSFLQTKEFDGLSPVERRSLAENAFKELDWYGKEQVEIDFKMAVMNYKHNIQEYYDRVPAVIKPLVLESIPKKFHQFLGQVDQSQFSEKDDEIVIKTEASNSTEGSNQIEKKGKKRKNTFIAAEESCTEEILESVTDYETDNTYSKRSPKKKKKRKRQNSDVEYSEVPEGSGDIMEDLEDVNNFNLQPYDESNVESSEEIHTQIKVEKKKKMKKTIETETLENNVITVTHQPPPTNTTKLKFGQTKRGF